MQADIDYEENPMRGPAQPPSDEKDVMPLKPILYNDEENVDLDFIKTRRKNGMQNKPKSIRGKKRSKVSSTC
jgi:hypothetical protein